MFAEYLKAAMKRAKFEVVEDDGSIMVPYRNFLALGQTLRPKTNAGAN